MSSNDPFSGGKLLVSWRIFNSNLESRLSAEEITGQHKQLVDEFIQRCNKYEWDRFDRTRSGNESLVWFFVKGVKFSEEKNSHFGSTVFFFDSFLE